MQLGQTEDYAVRALVDLARHPNARVEDIARRTGVPAPHLAKVIQALARSGLVETTRGRGGGVRLLHDPADIHLRRVVEAMQGPLRFLRCPRRGKGCPLNPDCPVFRTWSDVQAGVSAQLERVRIADLLRNPCELTESLTPEPG
jgi:Rrf2 family transcriptional regulator, nitric oxide-sensitive transcriptional repressor